MRGRTTLIVAHRRSTLHLADRIAVVDEGHVVDVGTHEELAERSRLYRELLSGFAEEEQEAIGDRVRRWPASVPRRGDAAAWSRAETRTALAPSPGRATNRASGAPSIGPGLGGGARLACQPGPVTELVNVWRH